MQTDFLKEIDNFAQKFQIDDSKKNEFNLAISEYIVANKWFGYKDTCEIHNKRLFVDEKLIKRMDKEFLKYGYRLGMNNTSKYKTISAEMLKAFPKTTNSFKTFSENNRLKVSEKYIILDFLLQYLVGELSIIDDREVGDILNIAWEELDTQTGNRLTDFINWYRQYHTTVYQNTFTLNKRNSDVKMREAYSTDEYLKMLYHLFNPEYIEANNMYAKAADTKEYADIWLYLSLHFVCAFRDTDILRFPHPRLRIAPEELLEKIKSGTYTDSEATTTLYTVLDILKFRQPKPNKTKRYNVPSLSIHIPINAEAHIGRLFAIAEAHYQLTEKSTNKPLIKATNDFETISKYMGKEIGKLFLEKNFSCRAMNKSYLQGLKDVADDMLETDNGYKIKGYNLAAKARSHKGGYGTFAHQTMTYLKDAKMSKLSPEEVTKELFERGVLSMIPSMLIKMIQGHDTFEKLSIKNQTALIKNLQLTPLETEKCVRIMQKNIKQCKAIVNEIYNRCSKEDILKALHDIGTYNDNALAKCDGCMCLMRALGNPCPYDGSNNCPSCPYEIQTKTTMFLMCAEVKRLFSLRDKAKTEFEKHKYKTMIENVVAPSILEMLQVFEEVYGESAARCLDEIAEVING